MIQPQRTQEGYDHIRETILNKCKLIPSSRETLDWNLDDFEIVSYACGDKLDKNKNLTFDHFEYAYPMKMSNNVNDRKEFYHFFCTSNCQETFVVARRKTSNN